MQAVLVQPVWIEQLDGIGQYVGYGVGQVVPIVDKTYCSRMFSWTLSRDHAANQHSDVFENQIDRGMQCLPILALFKPQQQVPVRTHGSDQTGTSMNINVTARQFKAHPVLLE